MKLQHPWTWTIVLVAALTSCGGDDDDDGGGDDDDAGGGPYTLTFIGNQYGPHNDEFLGVALVEKDTGRVVFTDDGRVTDGAFSFQWPGVLEEGRSYLIDFFGDHSGNAQCDAPPLDHTWREPVDAVRGDVTVTVTHNTNFEPDVCNSF